MTIPKYQTLTEDYTIKIPKKLVKELGWKVGSEIWIEIEDKDLKQVVIGTKLEGKDAVKGLERLQEIIIKENKK